MYAELRQTSMMETFEKTVNGKNWAKGIQSQQPTK